MTLTIGGLFSGYGGLEMGVQAALDGEIAWHSEIEAGPCKVLAHHWPDVPNLGDITAIDWTTVEPVDVMGGGSPCQDVSAAGRRAGMRPGTRSGLWESMREGIAVIRPRLVVWENVRGVTSAQAHSSLEYCPGCMGDPADRGDALRALGRVLGDLADLGYDAQWHGLRAADVGAPHGRFRVFVVATDANVGRLGRDRVRDDLRGIDQSRQPAPVAGRGERDFAAADARGQSRIERRRPASRHAQDGRALGEPAGRGRALAADASGARRAEGKDRGAGSGHAGPGAWSGEPQRNDRESAADTSGYEGRLSDGNGGTAADADGIGQQGLGRLDDQRRDADRRGSAETAWGPYQSAIRRWEHTLGRVAPAPTELGTKGNQRLSPKFVEWMMGLPVGHVTDPVIGLTRNEQLKALGNGVVPQQAEAAIRVCLARVVERAA